MSKQFVFLFLLLTFNIFAFPLPPKSIKYPENYEIYLPTYEDYLNNFLCDPFSPSSYTEAAIQCITIKNGDQNAKNYYFKNNKKDIMNMPTGWYVHEYRYDQDNPLSENTDGSPNYSYGYKFLPKTKNLEDLKKILREYYNYDGDQAKLKVLLAKLRNKGTLIETTGFFIDVLDVIQTDYDVPIFKVQLSKNENSIYNESKNTFDYVIIDGISYDEVFYILGSNVVANYLLYD